MDKIEKEAFKKWKVFNVRRREALICLKKDVNNW